MAAPQEKHAEKWYHKTRAVVAAFVIFGPFALPLLWRHPRYHLRVKVLGTIAVAVVTVVTWQATVKSVQTLQETYEQVFAPGGPDG